MTIRSDEFVLNDALLQQQGFVYRDDSCFQSHLLTAALPVFSSSLIQHHKRLYIHLPQLPSIPPNPTPPFRFSPGTGLICGLRVQRGIERIGANWNEGGNMKGEELGRERGSRGGVRARKKKKKTPQSEAMIWLLVLSSGEGKEERNDMERAREKWEGKEEGDLGLRVVCHPCGSFSHSFYIFYTTHKTVIYQTSRFKKKKKAGTKRYSVTSHQCFYINAMQLWWSQFSPEIKCASQSENSIPSLSVTAPCHSHD